MKSLLSIILISITLALAGCDVSNEDIAAAQHHNERALAAGNGLYIGVLPDGREVRAYCIDNPYSRYSHWIYVAGPDMTLNHAVKSGKTTINQVEAFIRSK